MNDVVVLKATDDMENRVHLTDVSEKLVSESFALGSALDQSRDVNEFDHGGGHLCGVVHFRQIVQPFVRHGYHADVRLNGAEGVVRGFSPRVGQCVEKRAFAHIGQSHDSEFHSPVSFPIAVFPYIIIRKSDFGKGATKIREKNFKNICFLRGNVL